VINLFGAIKSAPLTWRFHIFLTAMLEDHLSGSLWNPQLDVVKFTNCRILINHSVIKEDLWIANGAIIDAEKRFWMCSRDQNAKFAASVVIDCGNRIIVPGYIDVQINGAFGVDFSSPQLQEAQVEMVASELLKHGVTSFCPTMITSSPENYKRNLPLLKPRVGDRSRAHILGAHVEGPFLNQLKYGAHPKALLREPKSFDEILNCYGELFGQYARVITIAPELNGALDCIKEIVKRYPHICVSLGHSMANLVDAQKAVELGARMITHLFNAMVPFHHRDPGLIGLLGIAHAGLIPKSLFFGLITDGGIHTHAASVRMAWGTHPEGAVIVTDAMAAMGLENGVYKLGEMTVEVTDYHNNESIPSGNENSPRRKPLSSKKWKQAFVQGTQTLAGSVAQMDDSVQSFWRDSGCSFVDAVESASLHPAQALKIDHIKGSLNIGLDADLLVVDDSLNVQACIVKGELSWMKSDALKIWSI
jgi:N-acetylglucosamine-6-phosphate deacetylase